jgi:hypothetical protein
MRRLGWNLIIAALALLCCNTLSIETSQVSETPTVREVESAAPALTVGEAAHEKPDAPTPKTARVLGTELEVGTGGEAMTPGSAPILNVPVKPATAESYETPRQRKIWYGLMVVSHGSAAFDAWTTRRAISGGYGVEGDPLQKPFANSGAIYATTQVVPVITDFLGHRMMRSRHSWIRRTWWVPQAVSASVSFSAGIHNYNLAH